MKRHFRPRWHYTPPAGWINDPNGLCMVGETYHLFAQHHPDGTDWGPMHWAHATSRDLLHWQHQPIALAPDEYGMAFSGGAVLDKADTSGFAGPGADPALVLMYCQSGRVQQQGIAWSTDYTHFQPYDKNPVIPNGGLRDFRDPKPFWNPMLKCWGCVVASGDHIDFYRSDDLKRWHWTNAFGPAGNLPGVWECPDFFALPSPDGQLKWVLVVSMGRAKEDGGSCTQYFLGSFDGTAFFADPTGETRLVDPGFDNYAAITFENAPERIQIGWASNWTYAGLTPTGSYRGAMTLPRILSLRQTPSGLRLAAQPCQALDLLLKPAARLEAGEKDRSLSLTTESFGIRLTGKGPVSVSLANDAGERLCFGLTDPDTFFLDRSQASLLRFSDWYDRPLFQQLRVPRRVSGPYDMTFYFDVSICDWFADAGLLAVTSAVYPASPYTRLEVDGDAVLTLLI